jgi:hypothetical protein
MKFEPRRHGDTETTRERIFLPPCLRVSVVKIIAAMLVITATLAQPAVACPNCKENFAEQANGQNLARGFYWSILFMMGTPFAILGCFSGYMYYEVCKARRQAEALKQDEPRSREDAESRHDRALS